MILIVKLGECQRMWSWLMLKYYPLYCTDKVLNLNQRTFETSTKYEAGILLTRNP